MKIHKREFLVIPIFVLIASMYYLFVPVFPGLGGDFGEGAVTLFHSSYSSVCEGTVAIWNPNLWGGIPILGQTCFQSVYPINLLIYFVLSHSTFELFIVIDYAFHLSVLCTGLYFLQRLNKISILASFASVLMVAFSVEMMRQTVWIYLFTSIVWLPLMIDFIILFEREKSAKAWKYVLGAGITLGLAGLANQGQTLLINILIVGILYLCYIGLKFSKKYFLEMTGKMLSFGVIGIALCAPALFPAIEFTKNCSRYVPELGWLNSLDKMTIEAFVEYDTSFASFGSLLQFPTVNTDTNYYIISSIGGVISVLGILGFFVKSEKEQLVMNVFSKVIFVFVVCYSVGFVLPYIFYYIPFYNAIREPFLYIPYLILPLTLFVGQGIDLLKSNIFSLKEIKVKMSSPICASVILLICLVGIFLPYQASWKNIVLTLMIVFAYLINILLKKHRLRKIVVYGILGAIFILQTSINITETRNIYSYKDIYARIERQKVNNNIIFDSIPIPIDKATRFLGFGVNAWSQNALSLSQVSDALGYINPVPRSAQLASTASQRALLGNVKYWLSPLDTDSYHYQLLNQIGSKYIGDVELYPTYDSDMPETFGLWELDTLGAAWVVNDIINVKNLKYLSDQEVVDMLNDASVDFVNQAYIAQSDHTVNIEQGNNEWTTNIKEYGNNSVKYEVTTEKNAILATPEIWYPGWNVYVDGIKQNVIQVNCCYRGCEVPAGTHTVEFVYQPISLYLGILLSISGISYWLILLWIYKKKERLGIEI